MAEGIAGWNAGLTKSWTRFMTSARRCFGDLQYLGSREVQDGKRRADGQGRGALHPHVVLWSPVPIDVLELQALAMAAGFGCRLDLSPLSPAAHATYVAKYAHKHSGTPGHEIPWLLDQVDDDTGEVSRVPPLLHNRHAHAQGRCCPRRRTWSKSNGWGITMADLRDVRRRAWLASVTRPADAGGTDNSQPATASPPASGPEPAT